LFQRVLEKKILKKRQDSFLKDAIPELLKEAERLELTKHEVIKIIEEYKGGE